MEEKDVKEKDAKEKDVEEKDEYQRTYDRYLAEWKQVEDYWDKYFSVRRQYFQEINNYLSDFGSKLIGKRGQSNYINIDMGNLEEYLGSKFENVWKYLLGSIKVDIEKTMAEKEKTVVEREKTVTTEKEKTVAENQSQSDATSEKVQGAASLIECEYNEFMLRMKLIDMEAEGKIVIEGENGQFFSKGKYKDKLPEGKKYNITINLENSEKT